MIDSLIKVVVEIVQVIATIAPVVLLVYLLCKIADLGNEVERWKEKYWRLYDKHYGEEN